MSNYVRLNLGITKVYLLPCNGGYLMIDTGYSADYNKFRRKLAKNNISINQIKYLLLTHYHNDHVGFAGRLKDEFKIPLIVQRLSVPLLAVGESSFLENDSFITKKMKIALSIFFFFHGDFKYPPVAVDENDIVAEGDDDYILRSIGVNAKILHTPGHTMDSMSVLCDDGDAFVGDAATNFLGFLGTRYRTLCYTNLSQVYASISKLLKNGAKRVLPAHGSPFTSDKLEETLRYFAVKQMPD